MPPAQIAEAQKLAREWQAALETRGGKCESAELEALRVKANAGHADAQSNLGYAYDKGQGVPQDAAQAASWTRQAAEQGYAAAQYALGVLYASGRGVPQDYVESHRWGNLAASRASAENQTRFAETRDAVAKLMTPTQIEAAQTLASEWMAAFQKRGGK